MNNEDNKVNNNIENTNISNDTIIACEAKTEETNLENQASEVKNTVVESNNENKIEEQSNVVENNIKTEEVKAPKKSNKKLIIIIVCIIILCAIGFCIWYFLIKDNKKEQSTGEGITKISEEYKFIYGYSDYSIISLNNKLYIMDKEKNKYELDDTIKEKNYCEITNNYDSIKPIGILFGDCDNKKYGYYNVATAKIIIDENSGYNVGKHYLYKEENSILDFEGNTISKVDTKSLVQIGNYYYDYIITSNNKYAIFDKNGNWLFDKKYIYNFSYTNTNITTYDKNNFYVYDNNGKLLNTSKKYNTKNGYNVQSMDSDYLLVEKSNNYYIIDNNENLINEVKFTSNSSISFDSFSFNQEKNIITIDYAIEEENKSYAYFITDGKEEFNYKEETNSSNEKDTDSENEDDSDDSDEDDNTEDDEQTTGEISNLDEFINSYTQKGYVKLNAASGNLKKIDIDKIMRKFSTDNELTTADMGNIDISSKKIKLVSGTLKLYNGSKYVKDLTKNVTKMYEGSIAGDLYYSSVYVLTKDNYIIEYYINENEEIKIYKKYDISEYDGNVYYRLSGSSKTVYIKKNNKYYNVMNNATISNDDNVAFFNDEIIAYTNGKYISNENGKKTIGEIGYIVYDEIDEGVSIIPKEDVETVLVYDGGDDWDKWVTIYKDNTYKIDNIGKIYNNFDKIVILIQ